MIKIAFRPLVTMLLAATPLLAQDESISQEIIETGIPGGIHDGSVRSPAPKPDPIPFTVLESRTQRREVAESPEIPDVQGAKGVINVTVQVVADPGLPDPPPPLPPLSVDDPAVVARLAEARARYRESRALFVSASVIDHKRTILELYPGGAADGRVKVVSNIDFNHFSGFATFNVAGQGHDGVHEVRQYVLIMAIGNESAEARQRNAAKAGQEFYEPVLPILTDDGAPAYAVIEGADKEALQAINDMHVLYQSEGPRMFAAYLAREKALAERKAYLLANPPKPRDVTIQFWDRSPNPSNR